MNESDLTPILVHDFAIGFKTENTRPKKAIRLQRVYVKKQAWAYRG